MYILLSLGLPNPRFFISFATCYIGYASWPSSLIWISATVCSEIILSKTIICAPIWDAFSSYFGIGSPFMILSPSLAYMFIVEWIMQCILDISYVLLLANKFYLVVFYEIVVTLKFNGSIIISGFDPLIFLTFWILT